MKLYKVGLVGVLFFVFIFLIFVSGVCAADPDTNITDLDNNYLSDVNCSDNNIYTLNHDNVLYASDNVTALNNTTNNNAVTNDSSDLSDVPCAVSSYISVMESYNKTMNVKTAIKDTNTVNNVTSVDGLVSALTNQGLKCNVIKTNIKNLTALYNVPNVNIILHMFIKNKYHYAHVKEIKKDGILFNNNWFVPSNLLNSIYNNISIIISKEKFLNIDCFGENVNKSEWVNITGELSEKELFKFNIGLLDNSIIRYSKYTKLKDNIKDDGTKKGIAFLEHVLFGDTLKPKMANVLIIKKKLEPVIADSNVPDYLLRNFNNALTPMQHNLNDTISSLDYLINMIKKLDKNNKNLESYHNSTAITLKHVDISKLLNDCKESIIKNNLLNQFVDNFKESVNNLNPLNANPKLREYYEDKYGLDHHKFGFIDYYTLKK